MKNLFISFGIAVALFTTDNASAASTLVNGVTNQSFAPAFRATEFENSLFGNSDRRNYSPDKDLTILNPASVLPVYEKQIPEIIAEDLKITEGQILSESCFVFLEKSAEDVIFSDNQIIEATNVSEMQFLFLEKSDEEKMATDNQIIEAVSAEVQPLDFAVINRK